MPTQHQFTIQVNTLNDGFQTRTGIIPDNLRQEANDLIKLGQSLVQNWNQDANALSPNISNCITQLRQIAGPPF